jgi:hypothetical protein
MNTAHSVDCLLPYRSNKLVETPVAVGLDYPHHCCDGEVVTSASQAVDLCHH